ncbi:AAA family ATPase [Occallatibacter riparius]|uniref:AAA family ATPase n=1 Tax=Occallatibacter riparius TaxID=1002689 RepID=A0A9J7BSH8_9BACT|nr:AAA family ATPase [Occallatibacter riparius]UWZ85551.1 AAA family ATPase [Occallatibacter riparius]
MEKLNRNRYFAGIILAFFLLASGTSLYLRNQLAASQAAPTVGKAIQQMREHPSDWKTEKDISGMMSDLKTDKVAAIGISSSAVLVTTRTGERYFVLDEGGRVSGPILSAYENSAHASFPLALLASQSKSFEPSALEVAVDAAAVGLGLALVFGTFFRLRRKKRPNLTFNDVIGAEEAKQAFDDVVDYLRNPRRYADFGAKPPKGILLVGPPGVGKTRLAQALAGECNASFIDITGSAFSSPLYGMGIRQVKSVFRQARRKAPCILFIDEIDGIGKRTAVERASDAEPNRIINQLLTEMDGFHAANGVIVIGATNKPDALDEAMLREGRFDRKIHVDLPDLEDRKALFEHYTGKIAATDYLDVEQLARLTTGLSPAAIAASVNSAALVAARTGCSSLGMKHLCEAIEIQSMGEASGKVLTEAERRRIAIHEAGHAIVSAHTNTGTLEKVTILPRGPALGVTLVTPNKETELYLRSELENRIQMYLGGRIAERLVLGDVSSGAASDLTEASILAFRMVAEMGMSKDGKLFSLGACQKLGLHTDHLFYLDQTQELLNEMESRCTQMLEELRPALDELVEMLLERETVPGEEVKALVLNLSEPVLV